MKRFRLIILGVIDNFDFFEAKIDQLLSNQKHVELMVTEEKDGINAFVYEYARSRKLPVKRVAANYYPKYKGVMTTNGYCEGYDPKASENRDFELALVSDAVVIFGNEDHSFIEIAKMFKLKIKVVARKEVNE